MNETAIKALEIVHVSAAHTPNGILGATQVSDSVEGVDTVPNLRAIL